jgi:P-type E1-E2 ATPase
VDGGIPLPEADEIEEEAGFGIKGRIDDKRWEIRSGGVGRVFVKGEDGEGWTIVLGDRVRDDSREVVKQISATGREVVLVTGDVPGAADRMAAEAGISSSLAKLTPAMKADWIREKRDEGHSVLFVGDGLNDGPGLAQANVGVAMGTGAASSILVADGVISVPSLRPLLPGFWAARAARRSIRQNQIRSIVYNIGAVTVAAAGWVNPLIAALLMPLSSGMVIWGASRVERAVAANLGG